VRPTLYTEIAKLSGHKSTAVVDAVAAVSTNIEPDR